MGQFVTGEKQGEEGDITRTGLFGPDDPACQAEERTQQARGNTELYLWLASDVLGIVL